MTEDLARYTIKTLSSMRAGEKTSRREDARWGWSGASFVPFETAFLSSLLINCCQNDQLPLNAFYTALRVS